MKCLFFLVVSNTNLIFLEEHLGYALAVAIGYWVGGKSRHIIKANKTDDGKLSLLKLAELKEGQQSDGEIVIEQEKPIVEVVEQPIVEIIEPIVETIAEEQPPTETIVEQADYAPLIGVTHDVNLGDYDLTQESQEQSEQPILEPIVEAEQEVIEQEQTVLERNNEIE